MTALFCRRPPMMCLLGWQVASLRSPTQTCKYIHCQDHANLARGKWLSAIVSASRSLVRLLARLKNVLFLPQFSCSWPSEKNVIRVYFFLVLPSGFLYEIVGQRDFCFYSLVWADTLRTSESSAVFVAAVFESSVRFVGKFKNVDDKNLP